MNAIIGRGTELVDIGDIEVFVTSDGMYHAAQGDASLTVQVLWIRPAGETITRQVIAGASYDDGEDARDIEFEGDVTAETVAARLVTLIAGVA